MRTEVPSGDVVELNRRVRAAHASRAIAFLDRDLGTHKAAMAEIMECERQLGMIAAQSGALEQVSSDQPWPALPPFATAKTKAQEDLWITAAGIRSGRLASMGALNDAVARAALASGDSGDAKWKVAHAPIVIDTANTDRALLLKQTEAWHWAYEIHAVAGFLARSGRIGPRELAMALSAPSEPSDVYLDLDSNIYVPRSAVVKTNADEVAAGMRSFLRNGQRFLYTRKVPQSIEGIGIAARIEGTSLGMQMLQTAVGGRR